MGHNTNDYLAIAVARNEPEILGQDMTPGDICRRPRTPQVSRRLPHHQSRRPGGRLFGVHLAPADLAPCSP